MRRSGIVVGMVALAVASVLAWAPAAPATAAGTAFSFATTPGMQPAFSPGVSDYAVRCTGGATTLPGRIDARREGRLVLIRLP